MKRVKLLKLLDKLSVEIKRVSLFVEKAKEAADEIAKAAAASPSQSGDREHSKGQAEIASEVLKRLLMLHGEIAGARNTHPKRVTAPCWVKYKTLENKLSEFYFVSHPVFMTRSSEEPSRVVLVSKSSPLGAAVFSKKKGERFSYNTQGGARPSVGGTIVEIG